jgi:hypothetical protein
MAYGRMVKVTTPSLFGGVEEAVLYVVGAEDSVQAKKLIENEVVVGSKIEIVARVSHKLIFAVGLNPHMVTRI